MTSRERVLTALSCKEPDRVPYCEMGIDRIFADKLLNVHKAENDAMVIEENQFTIDEMNRLADILLLDNIFYVLRAPVFAEKFPGDHGRMFYGDGLIRTKDDLPGMQLPDPRKDSLYSAPADFCRQKGDRASVLITRIGIAPAMYSMGLEHFSISLFENPAFVEDVLDRYTEWACEVASRAEALGFDAVVNSDDIAYKTGPLFSPALFKEYMLPRYKRFRDSFSLPWIIHSDGDISPFIDDFISIGASTIHPCEKGAVDIRALKKKYQGDICLIGNLDLNILAAGTEEEVEQEVSGLVGDLAPGGGYILSSGNSLTSYVKPENALAMARAVKR